MAVLALSGTTSSGTPPIASKARTWASIQSGSACVQVALAKVKLDAPSTATKICAMRHRHRQRLLEGSTKLAEPRVAVAARVRGDVFVPKDQQGDVLALQFAMHVGPVRFLDPPMAAFAASAGVERRLQRLVVHVLRQGPGQACAVRPLQCLPHRRARQAKPAGDLVRRYRRRLQPNNLARTAHPDPLRWHRSSFGVAKGAT